MKHILVSWTIRDGDNQYEHSVIVETEKDFSDGLFVQILEEFYGTPAKWVETLESWELDGDYRLIQSPMTQILNKNELGVLRSLHITVTIKL